MPDVLITHSHDTRIPRKRLLYRTDVPSRTALRGFSFHKARARVLNMCGRPQMLFRMPGQARHPLRHFPAVYSYQVPCCRILNLRK